MATTLYQAALELAASLPREEQLRLIAELAEEKCEQAAGNANDKTMERSAAEQERIAKVIEDIREFRKGNGPITVEELISARDEGRRF